MDSVDALLAWGRSSGVHWEVTLEVRDGRRGRGVFASAPIERGTLLLRLPLELAVHPPPPVINLGCSNLLALALTVVHEIHVAQPRKPFFSLLAATPTPALPLLWTESDLSHLSSVSLLPGSDAAAASAAGSATFEEDVLPMMEALGELYLPRSVRTKSTFANSLALVISRAVLGRVSYEMGSSPSLWPYLRSDGPPERTDGPFLLPCFDLLNHSSLPDERSTRLRRADGQGGFELRAERDILADEEERSPRS